MVALASAARRRLRAVRGAVVGRAGAGAAAARGDDAAAAGARRGRAHVEDGADTVITRWPSALGRWCSGRAWAKGDGAGGAFARAIGGGGSTSRSSMTPTASTRSPRTSLCCASGAGADRADATRGRTRRVLERESSEGIEEHRLKAVRTAAERSGAASCSSRATTASSRCRRTSVAVSPGGDPGARHGRHGGRAGGSDRRAAREGARAALEAAAAGTLAHARAGRAAADRDRGREPRRGR